jgi:hypothetical protein
VEIHSNNNADRLRLQDGIKAATGFDPRHQRLFKENGEEYDGEAASGLT